MDILSNILTAVVGALAGGGLTAVAMLRINKASGRVDVFAKFTEATNSFTDAMTKQQDAFNNVLDLKNKGLESRDSLIKIYDQRLLDNEQLLREAIRSRKQVEFNVIELKRQVEGLQRQVNAEMSKRLYAEKYICFVEECKNRKPMLGTYKSNDIETEK